MIEIIGPENRKRRYDFKYQPLTWNHLIEKLELYDDIHDDEKELIRQAYSNLCKILGKGFLKEAKNANHELYDYFTNLAPDAIRSVIQFSSAIDNLKKYDTDEIILNRIKSKKHWNEGISLLELTEAFCNAGFLIKVEPSILANNNIKYPDLKLINPNERKELYLEVSNLNIAKQYDFNSQFFRIVKAAFPLKQISQDVYYCGKIFEFPEKSAQETINEIIKTRQKVNQEKSCIIINSDKMSLGFAHKSRKNELLKWADSQSFDLSSISGNSLDLSSDIKRVIRKIINKKKQLPKKQFGIIAISINPLTMIGVNLADLLWEIHDNIKNIPRIFGVFLYGISIREQKTDLKVIDNSFIFGKLELLYRSKSVIFLRNTAYEFPDDMAGTWNMLVNSITVE